MEIIYSKTYEQDKDSPTPNLQVSFIVMSYNNSNFLDECLATVSAQLDVDYEIVIGDDGSQDASPTKIKQYVESTSNKAVALLSSVNKGIVPNYNNCLKYCRGPYIAHIASDDFVSTNRLTIQLNALLKSGASMCVTSLDVVDSAGRLIRKRILKPGFISYQASGFPRGRINLPSPTMMYRRSLIDSFGLLPLDLFNEDEVLGARAINQNGVVAIAESTTYYRRHGRSVTSSTASLGIGRFIAWQRMNIPLRIRNVEEYIRINASTKNSKVSEQQLLITINGLNNAMDVINYLESGRRSRINARFIKGIFMLVKLYIFGLLRAVRDVVYKLVQN